MEMVVATRGPKLEWSSTRLGARHICVTGVTPTQRMGMAKPTLWMTCGSKQTITWMTATMAMSLMTYSTRWTSGLKNCSQVRLLLARVLSDSIAILRHSLFPFGWAKQPCVAGFDPKVWGACIRRVYNARIAGKVEAAAAQVAVGVTMAGRDGGGNSLFPTT